MRAISLSICKRQERTVAKTAIARTRGVSRFSAACQRSHPIPLMFMIVSTITTVPRRRMARAVKN